ncbi:MAG TPA: acyl-CoA thioesterase [Polyangiaceae bacterium]
MPPPMRRASKESAITLQQLMLPEHVNQLGVVHGGVVMKAIDEAGAICAMRHARRPCVTVSVDSIEFHLPVQVGQLLRCHARITWTGRTSIEVLVCVEAEDIIAGRVTQTNSAHVVYVALDEPGHPTEVPELLLCNEEDERLWQDAVERRQQRLARKNSG